MATWFGATFMRVAPMVVAVVLPIASSTPATTWMALATMKVVLVAT